MSENLSILRAAIQERGYQWSAGKTCLTDLPQNVLEKYARDFAESEKTELEVAHEKAFSPSQNLTGAYPHTWDWRDVNGTDWTTPVKDQGNCASGMVFAIVAAMESCLAISRKEPDPKLDLSEADLLFCGCGQCCSQDWAIEAAFDYLKEAGISDEECFPYSPVNQPCLPCPDRDERAIKIRNWHITTNPATAKEWIYRRGPVVTAMIIYTDFMDYYAGIYRQTTNDSRGVSVKAVVGYNETDGYWICKNSWSTKWGENGWFRIAYDSCGIGSQFGFYLLELTKQD